MDHNVELITLDPNITDTQVYQISPRLTITFCPIRAAPKYRARTRSLDLFKEEVRHLTQAIIDSNSQIVHAHWTYEFAEAAIRARKPTLITIHDLGWDYLFLYKDFYRAIRLIMKYRVMLRAQNVTAVSPFVSKKAWQYGFFRHVQIVPNPIDYCTFVKKSTSRPVLVTIGNSGPIKNVGASVEAYGLIKRVFPEAILHLFGPGLDSKSEFANHEGVVCHGNVPHEQLMRILEREATLLIHTSKLETFGVIIAEAKMRGVPVVAGLSSGGVPYVVGNAAGGALVDITKPSEIADAAITLLSNQELFHWHQKKAHEDAQRFLSSRIASKYYSIYEEIIKAEAYSK